MISSHARRHEARQDRGLADSLRAQAGQDIRQRRALTESCHIEPRRIHLTLGRVRVHEADQRLGRVAQVVEMGTPEGVRARRPPGVASLRRGVESARGEDQIVGREVAGEDPHRVFVPRPAVEHEEQARGSPFGSPHAQRPVFEGFKDGVIYGLHV